MIQMTKRLEPMPGSGTRSVKASLELVGRVRPRAELPAPVSVPAQILPLILMIAMIVIMVVLVGCDSGAGGPESGRTSVVMATVTGGPGTSGSVSAGDAGQIVEVARQWIESRVTAPYRDLSVTIVRRDQEFATTEVRAEVRQSAEAEWEESVATLELAKVGDKWRVDASKSGSLVSLTAVARQTEAVVASTATATAREEERFRGLLLSEVRALSADAAWARGAENKLLRWNGTAWERVEVPLEGEIDAMGVVSKDEVWFVMGEGRSLAHYKAGKWKEVKITKQGEFGAEYLTLYDIQMLSADEGWAAGGFNDIARYRDGRWEVQQDVPSAPDLMGVRSTLFRMRMFSPESGVFVARSGALLYWEGQSGGGAGVWRVATPGEWPRESLTIASVASLAEVWGFTSSSNTLLYYDTKDGTWQKVGMPVPTPTAGPRQWVKLRDIEMHSPVEGWAVGEAGSRGVVLRYENGRWQEVPNPAGGALYSISMATPSNGWAVGEGGIILRWDGTKWSVYGQ
ncbi:MAG TPA: hypothetical protein VF952_02530 [Chloroflexia bacterium]